MTPRIESFDQQDRTAVIDLLRRSSLPPDGLDDHWDTVLVARGGGGVVVGCAAVECYGRAGLLRSVAVDASHRGEGLGVRLTAAALDLARERGVTTVYLLTETADGFFPRFGFQVVTRADIAEPVHASAELRGACPESAIVMKRVMGTVEDGRGR